MIVFFSFVSGLFIRIWRPFLLEGDIIKEIEKSETMHQKDVVDCLKSFGWEVFRLNSGRKGGINLCKAGTPDLLAMKDGISVFIEIKKPGKEPTKIQLKRHEELRANGFKVLVIHSLDELMAYHRKN